MTQRSAICALVAGGAGFIGSHLCDALLERGHEVICLDNLQTARPSNLRAARAAAAASASSRPTSSTRCRPR